MVDAFSQRYQTVSACVSLLTFSLNLVLWLTCFDLTISHYNFIFSLLYCLKCCESLVKLSDVGEFCSPKLCLDDQQTGAEAQLPPLHKSSPNLFFDQLPSQQDQAACKQWKYWRIFGRKNIVYLGVCSLNGDSELSPFFDNLLLAIGFILLKQIRKSGKSGNDLEFIDQFEFWTTRFFDILQNWWVSAPQKEFLASLILMTFPLKIDDPYFVSGSS